jgi:sialate O-acetylesterase
MFGDSDDGVDSGEQRDLIIVFRPQIANPVAARYGFAPNPRCLLVNGAGLPAGPFRAPPAPN